MTLHKILSNRFGLGIFYGLLLIVCLVNRYVKSIRRIGVVLRLLPGLYAHVIDYFGAIWLREAVGQ